MSDAAGSMAAWRSRCDRHRLRRREDDGRAQAARRERVLVPELPPDLLEGEPRAARARPRRAGAAAGAAGPAARRARLRRRRGGRLGRACTRAPTRASPATARSRTSTTSTCGRCGASGCGPATAARASRTTCWRAPSTSPARTARPRSRATRVDNKGEKVDLTMAYVGTRSAVRAGRVREGGRHRLGAERLSPRPHAARPALTGLTGWPRGSARGIRCLPLAARRRGLARVGGIRNHGRMDVTEWLLDSDPSIRWQVMRDLLDEPAERSRPSGPASPPRGGVPSCSPCRPTTATGAATSTACTATARASPGRCTCCAGSASIPMPRRCARPIARVRDGVAWREWDDLPYFHGEVEECVNGGVLALGAYFGELGEGSDRIIERLLRRAARRRRLELRAPPSRQRSSFDTTICVLEGLLAYERRRRRRPARRSPRPAVAARSTCSSAACSAGGRPARSCSPATRTSRSRRTGSTTCCARSTTSARPAIAPDPRVADAIELLLAKRGDDGRWLAGVPWRGEVHFAVDAPEGEPSRWNTLRALRVLRWYDQE